MPIPESYVIQHGCHNCAYAFCWFDFDCGITYFCAFGALPRPLCGSVSMKEDFGRQCIPLDRWIKENGFDGKDIKEWHRPHMDYFHSIVRPLRKAWEDWSKGRECMAWGKCDQWQIKIDQNKTEKKS